MKHKKLFMEHTDIIVKYCKSNITFLFSLFLLCDVGHVAITLFEAAKFFAFFMCCYITFA